jgi:hypothetical protein
MANNNFIYYVILLTNIRTTTVVLRKMKSDLVYITLDTEEIQSVVTKIMGANTNLMATYR